MKLCLEPLLRRSLTAALFISALVVIGNSELNTTSPADRKTAQPRTIHESSAFFLVQTAVAPVIDGRLDDAVWQSAHAESLQLLADNRRTDGSRVPTAPTSVMALYDADNLYVAFACEGSSLPASDNRDTQEIYQSDCAEFFLNPEGGAGFKQILVNAHNDIAVNYVGARPLYELKPENIRHAVHTDSTGWQLEIAVPLKQLGISREQLPMFNGNFARENPAINEYSSLADLKTNFHEANRFIQLRFSDTPVTIRHYGITDGKLTFHIGEAHLQAQVAGFTQSSLTVIPLLRIGSDRDHLRDYPGAPVTLTPGQAPIISLQFTLTAEDSEYYLELRDAASGETLYTSEPFPFSGFGISSEVDRMLKGLQSLPMEIAAEELESELRELQIRSREPHHAAVWNELHEQTVALRQTLERLQLLVKQHRLPDLELGMSGYPASSLQKIFAAESIPANAQLGSPVTLSGAPGEYLNFQIVLLPLLNDLPELQVSCSGLNSSDGRTIAADQIELFRVKPVWVNGRLWPDILDRETNGTLSRTSHQQPFWGIVKVSSTVSAGEYRGEVNFSTSNGLEMRYPLTVQVQDFALPPLQTPPGIIFYYPEELMATHPSQWQEAEEHLVNDLMDHDLYPIPALSHPRTLDTFPFGLDRFYESKSERFNFTLVSIIPWLEWLRNFYENGRYPTPEAYYANLSQTIARDAARVKADGRLSDAYVYYDEVNTAQSEVKNVLDDLRTNTGLKVITCFCTPALGTEKIQYYEDSIDLFFFNDGYFTDPELLNYIKSLQRKGRKVGWYFNMSYPRFPTSNCIDAPGTANRIQFFLQWKYQIDTSLFWGANNWWPNDLTSDPLVMKQRGDGLLLYPSAKYVYLPSIRYELLREGIQDYRYLSALRQLLAQSADSIDPETLRLRACGAELLQVNWLHSIVDYPEDYQVLESERRKLIDCIAALHQRTGKN